MSTNNKEYNFIIRKTNYKDISIIGILKTLYKNQKYYIDGFGVKHHIGINRFDYKESIKRLISGKPLKEKVYSKIHFYLHTIQANSSKNTLLALNKRDSNKQYKRVFIVKYQNQSYAVTIKKPKYIELVYNKYLSNDYKELMIKAIKKEFALLMGGLQSEIIIYEA